MVDERLCDFFHFSLGYCIRSGRLDGQRVGPSLNVALRVRRPLLQPAHLRPFPLPSHHKMAE